MPLVSSSVQSFRPSGWQWQCAAKKPPRNSQRRLSLEAQQIALRQRYVALKIDYWHAVEAGDDSRAQRISADARALADGLKRVTTT